MNSIEGLSKKLKIWAPRKRKEWEAYFREKFGMKDTISTSKTNNENDSVRDSLGSISENSIDSPSVLAPDALTGTTSTFIRRRTATTTTRKMDKRDDNADAVALLREAKREAEAEGKKLGEGKEIVGGGKEKEKEKEKRVGIISQWLYSPETLQQMEKEKQLLEKMSEEEEMKYWETKMFGEKEKE